MNLYDILTQEDVVLSIRNNIDYILDIIPELKYEIGFSQNHPHHHLDVYEHTLLALSLSSNDFDVRLCLLLHDIGKPFSFQDEEVRHFKGHALVSSNMSRDILKRLGFEEKYIKKICYLIENHDTEITLDMIENNKELSNKLYMIQYCDALAHHPDKLDKRKKYLYNVKKLIMSKS